MGIILYLAFMNLYGVLRPDNAGNLYAFHTVWADYPFHTSVITSFVYEPHFQFPPSYPQFLHTEMHYPFLMDFYSAVLMKGGLDLRHSIIIPNILFQASLFGLFYYLAYRLTGLKMAGMIGSVIFIFAGFPPGLQSGGLHFLNPMYAVLMPQRTAMFGMALSFAVYNLLFESLFGAGGRSELFIAGMLTGMMPYIHAHSFMATAFVALFLAPASLLLRGDRDNRGRAGLKKLIIILVPLIALALPQILSIRAGVTENFFNFYPGWTDENKNIITALNWSSIPAVIYSAADTTILLLSFWAENAGALIILLCLGIIKARESAKLFFLPFLALFFITNFVKYQPWYFDNYKVFIHWLAVSAAIAPLSISWVVDELRTRVRVRYTHLATLSVCVLLIACTVFGVIAHVRMIKYDYWVWSACDREIADWVRDNTVPDGLFLTGSAHNHPITALAGRQRVMGYEGWLWSHGLNWTRIMKVKRDEIAMYKGNYRLIKDYGIDYVCIGPYERAFANENHFELNYSAFEDRARFRLIYEYGDGDKNNKPGCRCGWRIYKTQ
ncbi:MAG: hypothetical protein C4B56_00355 [Candidatus Methanophagaceae archaeon]|nr:MAG: hypothetical protein C4B56_00355 [Methanophagales archaeon]